MIDRMYLHFTRNRVPRELLYAAEATMCWVEINTLRDRDGWSLMIEGPRETIDALVAEFGKGENVAFMRNIASE